MGISCFSKSRLAGWMEQENLSDNDVSDSLGKFPSEIRRWRNGETKPTFDDLLRIRDAFGVEITHFIEVK